MTIKRQAQWTLATLCLLATTASPAWAQWSQFQGNAGHTGYVSDPIFAPSLELLWSVDAPEYSARSGDRGVAILDGNVYATMLDGNSARGPLPFESF